MNYDNLERNEKMKGFKEFGVAMTGVFPVKEAVELAKLAESLGLGSVWFAEDYFFRGGIPYMAAAAMATEKIRIGLGVVNPYSRHPALIAMEFATLDEMSNKRTVFGLGSGVPFWMEQMGIYDKKPISRTRACVDLVRKIMTGENINHEDKFFTAKDIKLVFEPVRKSAPIYLAFEGPQGLTLSGEIGDGVILSIFCTPGYVKFAWDKVAEGAKKAGKSLENYEMVAYMPMVIDDDLDKALGIAREFSKLYLPHSQAGGPLMSHAGVKAEENLAMAEAVKKGDDALLSQLITDKMLQELCVIGDADTCTKKLHQMVDSGANTLVAFPVPGTEPLETTKILGTEIMPRFK
ncbi:MAG: LLM class flavin-dependent oxidoreductase [Candidatus Thorarchaeota archaeon]|nr:LLM class flavin-dependent oxidoreductase [Candidatus Thorarchaeota archaeon]